jgi:hypothetical protein
VAFAGAAALLFALWPQAETVPVGPSPQIELQQIAALETPETSPLLPGRHQIQEDVVEVLDGGQVMALALAGTSGPDAHTRLRLDRGSARFEVAPREGGATFSVEAGEHRVRVVGTSFEVVLDPFEVRVSSGVVEVLHAAMQWTLGAGDRFANGQLYKALKSPATPSLPALDALRGLVLAGDLDGAQTGLAARLAVQPLDVDAAILAAQVETKLGQAEEAVRHWEQVIAHGSATQIQRAHYEAAVLLMDAPGEAVGHLRTFLRTPGPLSADARLRLGKALLAQGEEAQARAEFERLIQDHPGSTPAQVARELLASQ